MGLYGSDNSQKFIDDFLNIYLQNFKKELDERILQIKENKVVEAVDNLETYKTVVDDLENINEVKEDLLNIDKAVELAEPIDFIGKVYLGPHYTDPEIRNDGSDLEVGDIYFSKLINKLKIWNGEKWNSEVTTVEMVMNTDYFIADGKTKEFTLKQKYDFPNIQVSVNGSTIFPKPYGVCDMSNGESIIFDMFLPSGSMIQVNTWNTFSVANTYTKNDINAMNKLYSNNSITVDNDYKANNGETIWVDSRERNIRIELPTDPIDDTIVTLIDLYKVFNNSPVILFSTKYKIDGDIDEILINTSGRYEIIFKAGEWRIVR